MCGDSWAIKMLNGMKYKRKINELSQIYRSHFFLLTP